MIVLQCDHAGLQPLYQKLEDEMRRVIASMDEPRQMRDYVDMLMWRSREWFTTHRDSESRK